MLVADPMERAHMLGELLVVLTQLGQHVVRRHVVGVVVEHALEALDMADRADGIAAELAHALGDHVGHGIDLRRLIVEQQVIVAEMRARYVPVEILGLDVKRVDVGQQDVEGAGEILGRVGAKIGGSGKRGRFARLDVVLVHELNLLSTGD
jgi:hypothetical protein